MAQPGVRLAGIMASLMDRLARFVAGGDPAVRQQLEEADAFGRLKAAGAKVGAVCLLGSLLQMKCGMWVVEQCCHIWFVCVCSHLRSASHTL